MSLAYKNPHTRIKHLLEKGKIDQQWLKASCVSWLQSHPLIHVKEKIDFNIESKDPLELAKTALSHFVMRRYDEQHLTPKEKRQIKERNRYRTGGDIYEKNQREYKTRIVNFLYLYVYKFKKHDDEISFDVWINWGRNPRHKGDFNHKVSKAARRKLVDEQLGKLGFVRFKWIYNKDLRSKFSRDWEDCYKEVFDALLKLAEQNKQRRSGEIAHIELGSNEFQRNEIWNFVTSHKISRVKPKPIDISDSRLEWNRKYGNLAKTGKDRESLKDLYILEDHEIKQQIDDEERLNAEKEMKRLRRTKRFNDIATGKIKLPSYIYLMIMTQARMFGIDSIDDILGENQ